MSLDKLKPEVQRTMAITVPLLVLLFAAFLVAPKILGISTISGQAAARRTEAMVRKQQNVMELATEDKQRLAAYPESKGEQLAFLKELNRMVSASGVHLVSYRPPTGASIGDDPSVRPVATEVTVSGSFSDLVMLFQTLASAPRLFAVENLQVRNDAYPRLSAGFRLVRYVTPLDMAMVPRPAGQW